MKFQLLPKKIGFSDKLSNKLFYYFNKEKTKIFGDGEGLSFHRKRTFFDKLGSVYSMFTLENQNPYKIVKDIEKFKKQVVTFISHPKLLSEISFLCIYKLADCGYNFQTIFDFTSDLDFKENL